MGNCDLVFVFLALTLYFMVLDLMALFVTYVWRKVRRQSFQTHGRGLFLLSDGFFSGALLSYFVFLIFLTIEATCQR